MPHSENEDAQPVSNPEQQWPLWIQVVLTLLLFLVCVYAPWVITTKYSHIGGLASCVAAFFLWALTGPRPVPGFIPGILAMAVLFSNIFCAVVSLTLIFPSVFHHHVHHP